MRVREVCLGFALVLAGSALAQEIEIQAELTAPLGTDVSRKGDSITARVVSPPALQGDFLNGRVNESKPGGKLTGRAVLSFSFDTLLHGGQAVPISAQVKGLINSKGQPNVDEEGRAVSRANSNLAKAAVGTGLGGLIGGLAGGGKGAVIGAVTGAAVSVILIEATAQGPSVRFAAGSRVLLTARGRGGPELATLPPNAAPQQQNAAAQGYPAPAQNPASAVAAAAPAPVVPVNQPAGAAPAMGGQPDLTAIKADFMPGEKILLYDDFTDMAGDEPPPHWKVRGTTPELKVGPGIRQLTVKGENVVLTPNLEGLPKNFTMETDLVIEGPADSRPEVEWYFLDKGNQRAMSLLSKQEGPKAWYLRLFAGEELLGTGTFPVDWSQVVKMALWVQNGRVRLYVNGQRLYDANQVKVADIKTVQEHMDTGGESVGYRFVRFTESTPDFSQTIASTGRYVTHGILFDTDSDVLKPESAAVIRSIARGLETNPNLRLQIEGHTDSTGNADHNLDLSRRRAQVVKEVLASQFNVDASRLTVAGMGATKPMDSNDTPQGRAQNRRVEFVRQ